MASSTKAFGPNDVSSTRTMLHESIPLTGTMVSGTNPNGGYNDANIKRFSHGQFTSVYDYPYLSSSANHIFDVTVGVSPSSNLSASTVPDISKKVRMYNTMAATLLGYDDTGTILEFDQDGDITSGGTKHREVVFVNFSRLLTKDGIKKGSFRHTWNVEGTEAAPNTDNAITLGDYGAANSYKVNSAAGDYGLLLSSSTAASTSALGLLWYDAGVAVLTASLFSGEFGGKSKTYDTSSANLAFQAGTIDGLADGVRNRWADCDFSNTVELHSTIYFCRLDSGEFNYASSANGTYLSGSRIVNKDSSKDEPTTYFSGIELLGPSGEVLGRARLSEYLKKTPSNSLTIRCRTDY
jgi:hypothetical protein